MCDLLLCKHIHPFVFVYLFKYALKCTEYNGLVRTKKTFGNMQEDIDNDDVFVIIFFVIKLNN
jgi:hypothetical protein